MYFKFLFNFIIIIILAPSGSLIVQKSTIQVYFKIDYLTVIFKKAFFLLECLNVFFNSSLEFCKEPPDVKAGKEVLFSVEMC